MDTQLIITCGGQYFNILGTDDLSFIYLFIIHHDDIFFFFNVNYLKNKRTLIHNRLIAGTQYKT